MLLNPGEKTIMAQFVLYFVFCGTTPSAAFLILSSLAGEAKQMEVVPFNGFFREKDNLLFFAAGIHCPFSSLTFLYNLAHSIHKCMHSTLYGGVIYICSDFLHAFESTFHVPEEFLILILWFYNELSQV